MTDERIEPHNVSLYPSDWRIIEQVARETGIRSMSAALRLILKEWRTHKANEVNNDGLPIQQRA
jgi:hypothetical protein